MAWLLQVWEGRMQGFREADREGATDLPWQGWSRATTQTHTASGVCWVPPAAAGSTVHSGCPVSVPASTYEPGVLVSPGVS